MCIVDSDGKSNASSLEDHRELLHPVGKEEKQKISWKSAIVNTFPIWGVSVLILLVTVVVPEYYSPNLMTDTSFFEPIAHFSITNSLTFIFSNIMEVEDANYSYDVGTGAFESILLITCTTLILFRNRVDNGVSLLSPFFGPFQNIANSDTRAIVWLYVALGGCATLGSVFGLGDESIARHMSEAFLEWFQYGWVAIASAVGVLGSFFTGANTNSTTTFAQDQYDAAIVLNRSPSTMIALQVVGGAAGNMLSLGKIFTLKYHLRQVEDVPDKIFLRRNFRLIIVFFVVALPAGFVFVEVFR